MSVMKYEGSQIHKAISAIKSKIDEIEKKYPKTTKKENPEHINTKKYIALFKEALNVLNFFLTICSEDQINCGELLTFATSARQIHSKYIALLDKTREGFYREVVIEILNLKLDSIDGSLNQKIDGIILIIQHKHQNNKYSAEVIKELSNLKDLPLNSEILTQQIITHLICNLFPKNDMFRELADEIIAILPSVKSEENINFLPSSFIINILSTISNVPFIGSSLLSLVPYTFEHLKEKDKYLYKITEKTGARSEEQIDLKEKYKTKHGYISSSLIAARNRYLATNGIFENQAMDPRVAELLEKINKLNAIKLENIDVSFKTPSINSDFSECCDEIETLNDTHKMDSLDALEPDKIISKADQLIVELDKLKNKIYEIMDYNIEQNFTHIIIENNQFAIPRLVTNDNQIKIRSANIISFIEFYKRYLTKQKRAALTQIIITKRIDYSQRTQSDDIEELNKLKDEIASEILKVEDIEELKKELNHRQELVEDKIKDILKQKELEEKEGTSSLIYLTSLLCKEDDKINSLETNLSELNLLTDEQENLKKSIAASEIEVKQLEKDIEEKTRLRSMILPEELKPTKTMEQLLENIKDAPNPNNPIKSPSISSRLLNSFTSISGMTPTTNSSIKSTNTATDEHLSMINSQIKHIYAEERLSEITATEEKLQEGKSKLQIDKKRLEALEELATHIKQKIKLETLIEIRQDIDKYKAEVDKTKDYTIHELAQNIEVNDRLHLDIHNKLNELEPDYLSNNLIDLLNSLIESYQNNKALVISNQNESINLKFANLKQYFDDLINDMDLNKLEKFLVQRESFLSELDTLTPTYKTLGINDPELQKLRLTLEGYISQKTSAVKSHLDKAIDEVIKLYTTVENKAQESYPKYAELIKNLSKKIKNCEKINEFYKALTANDTHNTQTASIQTNESLYSLKLKTKRLKIKQKYNNKLEKYSLSIYSLSIKENVKNIKNALEAYVENGDKESIIKLINQNINKADLVLSSTLNQLKVALLEDNTAKPNADEIKTFSVSTANNEFNKQINNLYNEVKKLETNKNKHLKELANALLLDIKELIKDGREIPKPDEYNKFKEKFLARLHSQDDIITSDEDRITTIALLVISLGLLLLASYAVTKLTTGRAFLFWETSEKQKRIASIDNLVVTLQLAAT